MTERPGTWRRALAASVLGMLFATGGGTGLAEDVALRTALPSELAAETLLLGAARAGDRLVAVGSFGHVVLSDDEGESWRQAKVVPTQSVLTGVCFADEQHGWAVGHEGVVLHSRDGGETWTRQRAEPQDETPLFSVLCIDESHATAVGAFGLALRTRDGGQAWEAFPVGGDNDDLHLNELFRTADGTLYIAAEVGTVYRSRDGGATWEMLQTPYDGSYWGGLDLGDGGVLVFGLRGTVMRSEDQGETWTRVDSGTDQSFGGAGVHTDGSIVLSGLSGAFARSDDGGRSFRAATRPSRLGSRAVLVTRSGRVLFFGEGGVEALAE